MTSLCLSHLYSECTEESPYAYMLITQILGLQNISQVSGFNTFCLGFLLVRAFGHMMK